MFELRKLLEALATPLAIGTALVVLGLLWGARRSRRVGWSLVGAGVVVIVAFAFGPVATALIGSLEAGYRPIEGSACERADAIVILGGAIKARAHSDLHPRLLPGSDRIWEGSRLYRAGCAPLVFISAGGRPGIAPGATEAAGIREFLISLGVPDHAVLAEGRSRTTGENAAVSRDILVPLGVRRILLVTSAWHMRRAVREYERRGFTVIPAPADFRSLDPEEGGLARWLPNADALALSQVGIKEYLGYWVQSLVH